MKNVRELIADDLEDAIDARSLRTWFGNDEGAARYCEIVRRLRVYDAMRKAFEATHG